MKTTKGGKVMNPTDAYRKELRKKELKRNKKERKKVREAGILKKDPETIKEQIEKLEAMKVDGALDKARKHKKRQLEDTLNLVMKKRKEYEEKMREKGETPIMFSHLGPPKRRTTVVEDERAKHPKPEDSVYYHPTLNPTGAPPPGKPPMYKSSIGPRLPLGASSSKEKSMPEQEEVNEAFLPPPPTSATSVEDADVPKFIPLPPEISAPPKPATESTIVPPPPPPLPSLPQETTGVQSSPPPPPGTSQTEREKKQNISSDVQSLKEVGLAGISRPAPPPPPPGLPPKQADQLAYVEKSEYNPNNSSVASDISRTPLPPPPPRHAPPPPPRFPMIPSLQADVLPPGISRIPPNPQDMRPGLPTPGLSSQPLPLGMIAPMPMANFAGQQAMPLVGGLQPMMMPPLHPSIPHQEDENAVGVGIPVPPKPSYVKSAASTVVKRPLAQHTPELTAMVPASVRVRRETAAPKPKPKSQIHVPSSSLKPFIHSTGVGTSDEPRPTPSSTSKSQSIDDSYTAFLEDMKALGALDG